MGFCQLGVSRAWVVLRVPTVPFHYFAPGGCCQQNSTYKVPKVCLPWPQIPGTGLEEVDKGFGYDVASSYKFPLTFGTSSISHRRCNSGFGARLNMD
jgi:hypothetical protein